MAIFLIGFALVLFDLNIAVGSASIGVFPDMIGYALMLSALAGKRAPREKIVRFRRIAAVSMIVTLVVYVLALFGAAKWLEGWFYVALDLGCYVLECIAGYEVVGLFREADSSANGAAGKKVFSCWRLSVIFGALAFFGVFSPASAILLGGMSFVTDAYLIVTCFKTAAAQGSIAY